MKSDHEKPEREKEATYPNPSRSAEIRQLIEDYVNDLREIIKKLRRKMN
jgi:hypothetical protein